jgi:hypothetical protein
MTTDRMTKALLLAITVGLWANVVTTWLGPMPVQAQSGVIQVDVIRVGGKDVVCGFGCGGFGSSGIPVDIQ